MSYHNQRSRSPRSRDSSDRRDREWSGRGSFGRGDHHNSTGLNRREEFQRSFNSGQRSSYQEQTDYRRDERVDRRWSDRDDRFRDRGSGMGHRGSRFSGGGHYTEGASYEEQRPYRNPMFQDHDRGYPQQEDRVYRNPIYNDRGRERSFPTPGAGFQLDNSADSSILTAPTNIMQNCTYSATFYRDNLLGATDEYISKNKILSYKKPMESKPEENESSMNDSVSSIEASPSTTAAVAPIPNRSKNSEDFISFSKKSKVTHFDSDNPGAKKKSERFKTIKEGIEYYNSAVREQTRNIELWREFVQFQDQIFEYDESNTGRKGKNSYRKQMIEKKIAILEKAISQNPKCTDLQFDRLELLKEIAKPSEVTREWKQLLANNSDNPCIWLERLGHSATDLQNFSSSGLIKEFTTIFEKFRLMLTPSYPEFQKPKKLFTLIADTFLCLCGILKASGFTEKAFALQQAQLEIDFNLPKESLESAKGKNEHSKISHLFKVFWDLGTLHFGESGALGWSQVLDLGENALRRKEESITVADGRVGSFEETFFDYLTELDDKPQKSSNWLLIESMRSKLYWSPWRKILSDSDECDDSQRVVLSSEITPFLIAAPEDCSHEMEKEAFYFRHVVNYLLLQDEGFIPRTHTLDSVLSPFSTIRLSESRVLFSEIYYWKQFMKLYVEEEKQESWIPEGFRLPEYTVINTSTIVDAENLISILPTVNESISNDQDAILKENEERVTAQIQSIVEQCIEKLEPKFAEILVQMYIRYIQKSTAGSSKQVRKQKLKDCKNLLKHEKLRSSISTYGELALLEYFGGSKKKAISILFKTINSTSNILRSQEGSDMTELNLDSNWELVSEITKLYRILAEFYIKDKPDVALNILVALGNKFSCVELDLEDDEAMNVKPTSTQILKAKTFFESVLESINQSERSGDGVEEEDGEEAGLSCILSKWGGDFCLEFYLQRTNIVIEWTSAFALFHFLSTSYESACGVLEKVLSWIQVPELSKNGRHDPLIANGHHIKEHLYIIWLKLGAMVVNKNPVEHSKFRTLLAAALDLYPSSPPILLLYTTVEGQCSIAGKLWRIMVKKIKQETGNNICTLQWAPLFMSLTLAKQIEEIERDTQEALDEFGLGGPAVPPDTIFYKLDAILSAAGNHPLTRNCPLIWRVHLRHLALRCKVGKDLKRAKGIFYEAIRNAPSTKSLYMDAIAYFPNLMKEVMDLMAEKQLLVRLPTEELDLLLNIGDELEEEMQATSSKVKSSSKSKSKNLEVVELSD